MTRILRAISLIGAVLAATGATQAADEVQVYLDSPQFASRLADMHAMANKSYFNGCETFKAGAPKIAVLEPIKIGDGAPKSGKWKVSEAAEGCGKSRIINAFFVVGKDDKVHFLLAAPGTTMGDFRLQSDTVMYALLAIVKKAPGCKQTGITDTRFDSEDRLSDEFKATAVKMGQTLTKKWHETWTVEGCGRVFEVRIDYLFGNTGTNITASSENVVEVTPPAGAAAKP